MAGFFPPTRPKFSAALRDELAESPKLRVLAAQSLSSPPSGQHQQALGPLMRLADDSDPNVRAAALAGLGRLGPKLTASETEPALDIISLRFEDGDAVVRQVAIIAAAELGSKAAMPGLARALDDRRPEVRFQAIGAYCELAGSDAVCRLAPLADDPDTEVRVCLADTLGSLESTEAGPTLARMLADRASAARLAAAIALARIGDKAGQSELIAALPRSDRTFEICWSLGELGAQEARSALTTLARSPLKSLSFRAAAGAALVRLGDPIGEQTLRMVLTALRWEARSYAVEMVGELELHALSPEIARLSLRPRGADRVVIARALAKLAPGSDVARQALKTMANDDDEGAAEARLLIAAS